MYKKTHLFILFFLPLFVIACGQEADSAEEATPQTLFVFGDSWADQMDDTVFPQELEERGFDEVVMVEPLGVGGTTMAQWANDADGLLTELLTAIEEDPFANPIVFFTLSGNDLLGGGTMDDVLANLRTLLTELEATRDDVQIVYAGYDILNPAIEEAQCNGLLNNLFGTSDPELTNTQWIFSYEMIEEVIAEFEKTTAVNTYGSLQGQPGSPALDEWSDVEYLNDCIHLNAEGYGVYLDTVFDEAITPLVCSNGSVESSACNP